MLFIGLAFCLFAGLVHFTTLSLVASALITGVLFVVLGVLKGERL